VRDEPLLLRFAPQRKGDGAPAEHLILRVSSEDVLELDVTEKCLRFGDEIVDRLTTFTLPSVELSPRSKLPPRLERHASHRPASAALHQWRDRSSYVQQRAGTPV